MDVSYHVRWRLCNAFDVRANITERELEMMFKDNPAKAIGLPVATSSAGR